MLSSMEYATSADKGATPPLVDAKKPLIHIRVQTGKICQPLHCMEKIKLTNNLVDGTATQKLVDWQQ